MWVILTTSCLFFQSADSVATEYSVKFDDSMTEDDIEERSFRSLLPSEAHRRESLDRKPSARPESDDDHSHDRSSPRVSSKVISCQHSSCHTSSGSSFVHYVRACCVSFCLVVMVCFWIPGVLIRSSLYVMMGTWLRLCVFPLLFSYHAIHSRMTACPSPAARTASPSSPWTWCVSTWRRRKFALSIRVLCCVCVRRPSERRPRLN